MIIDRHTRFVRRLRGGENGWAGPALPSAVLLAVLLCGVPAEANAQTPEWAADPVQLAYSCEPTPHGSELAAELEDDASPPGSGTSEARLRILLDSDVDNPILTLSLARCVLAASGHSAAGPGIARAATLIEARHDRVAPQAAQPTKRSGPNPQYPEKAWEAGVFGVVAVETTVDQNGRVQETRVVESRPALDEEAERTVKRWRFDMPAGAHATAPFVVFLKFGPVVELTVADFIDVARVSVRTNHWPRARQAIREAQALNERLIAAETVSDALLQDVEGFVDPKVVRMAEPLYSQRALQKHVSGAVEIEALIRTDGRTQVVRVTSGLERDLDQAAVRAVEQSRFEPASNKGVDVETLATFVMRFTLHH